MRRGRRGAYHRELIAVGLVGAGAMLVACNLIAGIDEGTLVDAGSDGGGATRRDGGLGIDGGGRDGGRRDGASDATAHDGSIEAAKGDGTTGGGDAEAGVEQYNCAIQGGSSAVSLGALTSGLDGVVQLFLANTGTNNSKQLRVFVPDGTDSAPIYHMYTFSQGGQASDTPIPAGNVLTVVRYTTGIGALIIEQDPNNVNAKVLAVTTLEDSLVGDATAPAWSTPVIVGDDAVLSDCSSFNYRGALVVNNAAQQDYSVVSSCAGEASVLLKALHYVHGQASAFLWPPPPTGFDGGAPIAPHIPGIAVVNGNLYVMTTPGSGSSQVPPTGSGPSLYAAPVSLDAAAPTPTTLKVNDASDFMIGAALGSTVTNEVGVMVLEADLQSVTGDAVIYAGSVPGSTLRTLTATTPFTATPVAGLAELPLINNGGAHWQSFASPPSDNLIAVGAEYPNSNGLNFMWWNGAGQLVARKVGTGAFFYSDPDGGAGPVIYGGDVALSGPPLAATTSFVVAYVKETGTASSPAQGVFAGTIVCTGIQ